MMISYDNLGCSIVSRIHDQNGLGTILVGQTTNVYDD